MWLGPASHLDYLLVPILIARNLARWWVLLLLHLFSLIVLDEDFCKKSWVSIVHFVMNVI